MAYHVRLSLSGTIDYYEELTRQLEPEKHVLWLLATEFSNLLQKHHHLFVLPAISHYVDELEAVLVGISHAQHGKLFGKEHNNCQSLQG